MNKIFKLFAALLVFAVFIACGEKKSEPKATTEQSEKAAELTEDDFTIEEKKEEAPVAESGIIDGINAKQTFKQSCAVCHGTDGKLGANGSKDLSLSTLTIDEKINMITKGKGVMIAFEAILKPEEIKAVAKYTEQLKG
jgi:mono/diheme cytochrome c family protein